jgi:hypothetical protein
VESSTELHYTLSMDGDMGWPLGPDQQQLLGELAALVARSGAWRFLHAPVVAADAEHYPDQWEETRAGVARIVGRTLWHAYVGINAVIEVRQPAKRDLDLLRATHFELAHVDVSSAVFEFSAIGNDDVASRSHRSCRGSVPGAIRLRASVLSVRELWRAGHGDPRGVQCVRRANRRRARESRRSAGTRRGARRGGARVRQDRRTFRGRLADELGITYRLANRIPMCLLK